MGEGELQEVEVGEISGDVGNVTVGVSVSIGVDEAVGNGVCDEKGVGDSVACGLGKLSRLEPKTAKIATTMIATRAKAEAASFVFVLFFGNGGGGGGGVTSRIMLNRVLFH